MAACGKYLYSCNHESIARPGPTLLSDVRVRFRPDKKHVQYENGC